MKKYCTAVLLLLLTYTAQAFATTVVASPANGSTVSSTVQFAATASSACQQGVASMGVYVDNRLAYVANGASLNATLNLSNGAHHTFVQEWDYCGGSNGTPINVQVAGDNAGVYVSSPANNSTVNGAVNYVATATTSCPQGVAAMGVYVGTELAAVAAGASLNQQLTLPAGPQQTVVQEWDNCGGATSQQVTVNVQAMGHTLANLQALDGWTGWGELAPTYNICDSGCPGVALDMTPHQSSISLSGNATRFDLGGTTPYSDALWSNKLIGQGTTENMPDPHRTLLPSLHNFTYDAYVYVTDVAVTQDLEFDVNMYMGGVGMEWGTECNHLADGDWDIWDNVNAAWVSTGAACSLNENAWNHVTIQVQRESDNSLLYQSITMNGVTVNINRTMPPFGVPNGWYGLTVNYQMDGNYRQAANTTYLDNFSLTYW